MSDSVFSSRLMVEVLYMGEGEQPFICAINGRIAMRGIREIEKELRDEQAFDEGEGLYLYEASYYEGQYDDIGRCEIRPGWELTLISHDPGWMTQDEGEQS